MADPYADFLRKLFYVVGARFHACKKRDGGARSGIVQGAVVAEVDIEVCAYGVELVIVKSRPDLACDAHGAACAKIRRLQAIGKERRLEHAHVEGRIVRDDDFSGKALLQLFPDLGEGRRICHILRAYAVNTDVEAVEAKSGRLNERRPPFL